MQFYMGIVTSPYIVIHFITDLATQEGRSCKPLTDLIILTWQYPFRWRKALYWNKHMGYEIYNGHFGGPFYQQGFTEPLLDESCYTTVFCGHDLCPNHDLEDIVIKDAAFHTRTHQFPLASPIWALFVQVVGISVLPG